MQATAKNKRARAERARNVVVPRDELVANVRARAEAEVEQLAIERFGRPVDDFEAEARRWTDDKAAYARRIAIGRPRERVEGFVPSARTPLYRLVLAFARGDGWWWTGKPSNRDIALLAILSGVVKSDAWHGATTVAAAIELVVQAVAKWRRTLSGGVQESTWKAAPGKRGRPLKRTAT